MFLIIAAELIEIIFMILVAIGIEHAPSAASPPYSPYSHSLIMGILWSVLAGLITWIFSKNNWTSWIIGKNKIVAEVGEVGILVAGFFIYLMTLKQLRVRKKKYIER